MSNIRLPERLTAALSPISWPQKLLLAALFSAVCALAVWGTLFSPAHWWGDPEAQRVTVAPGSNARAIAIELADAGLIRNAAAFRLLGRATGNTSGMRAGVYDFSPKENSWQILRRLSRGDSVDLAVTVTIPEGYTVKQIAQVLESHGICKASDFLIYLRTAALPYDFLGQQSAQVPVEGRFEGLLFPDSYRLLPGTSPTEVVQVMTGRFRQVMEGLLPTAVLQGGKTENTPVALDMQQLITLASIIEREAVVDEERGTIAGVFYNRLKINQPLQSCATVQYILEKVKPVLSIADTETKSPYNTYRNGGLTPGPIAVAGLPSLQAALSPTATDYYYFVAIGDGSGQHIFSKTFAEHNQAIRDLSNK